MLDFIPAQTRKSLLIATTGLALAGCTTIAELGDSIDRPPPAGVAQPTPIASNVTDINGVTTYDNYQTVRARGGDTVRSVADRIGIDATPLASHNGLVEDSVLNDGQVLLIPPSLRVSSNASSDGLIAITSEALDSVPTNTASTPSQNNNAEPLRHSVQAGETAFEIARRYGVSVTALASWNGLDADLELRQGQRLLIPTGATVRNSADDAGAADNSASNNTNSAQRPSQRPDNNQNQNTIVDAPAPTAPATSETQVVAPEPAPKPTPTPAPTSPSTASQSNNNAAFSAPVDGEILRGYSNKTNGNEGIDFKAALGSNVRAAADGNVVLITKSSDADTDIVLLRHDNKLYTVYANINAGDLQKGARIGRGETIGKIAGGNPPYVHFEVRNGTDAVDPTPYLQ